MKKKTFGIVVLGAVMAFGSYTGLTQAADDTAKPAQPAPTTPRTRPSMADMIKNYRDQFEGVKLSDDQMKKIDGFVSTAEVEIKKAADSTDRETRRGAFTAFQKLNTDVASVLDDTQKTQLGKKAHAARIERFKKPYIAPELKLTDDQTSKINAIVADLDKALPVTPFGAAPDRESFQKRNETYKDAREKLKAVLTPEQQKLIPEPRGFGNRGGRNGQAPKPPTTGA